jgi:hypothetical protein
MTKPFDRALLTEVDMRNVNWLLAAGLITATTAACTTDSGYYPSTSSNGYYSNGTYYNSGYATAPSTAYNSGYYSAPSVTYSSGYYAAPRPRTVSRYGPNGDYDRDGIPNRYDRDANGDGVPDRYQR